MTNAINDGLSKPDQLAIDAVDTVEIEDGQVTTVKLANPVQFGAGSLTAGSIFAVTFDTAFGTAPSIVCDYQEGSAPGVVSPSGIVTTGFVAVGDTAAKYINWIAIGPVA